MNENREGDLFDGESEILKQLEQTYLTAYPNPDRIGCPSPVIIEQIVSGQIRPPVGSDIVQHLTHCSPCFKSFIDARDRLRSHRGKVFTTTRRARVAAMAGLVILGGGALFLWQRIKSTPTPTSTDSTILQPADRIASIHVDLQSYSLERGGSGPDRPANIIGPTLPNKPVKLNLSLPIGFEEGNYNVRISRTVEGPALVQSNGIAHLVGHAVELDTSLDLTRFSPGTYFLGIRQQGLSWAHVQILVK